MILFLFILGLFVGSFLGVLVDRIPKNKPFLTGRSYCDNCKKALSWLDLIPVVSFIFLKGKCRYCHANLSLFYPVIEITAGVMFALTYVFLISNFKFQISNFIELIYYLFIVSSLIVVFFTDLKYGIIPDKILYPAILVTFLWLIIGHQSPAPRSFSEVGLIINHLLTGIGSFLFLLAVPYLYFLLTKKFGMGGGDIKFAFLMGLILGFPNIVISFYIAFLTGAFFSIILILWKKKNIQSGKIAFGPFLVVGTILSLYWGNQISLYLMRLFGI
ncbi:MAG: hypothetical protein A2171_01910 [Candidatus Levybacteria bacterium RBG_13_35_9]|nr:MAG: hypothetical protein A2171_01910 [Candidatus Levybacteria bacterium RBG_13_35_9]